MAKKRVVRKIKKIVKPKDCYFCVEQKLPWYSDVETLRKFLTERGKIIGKDRNGLCAKHQRRLGTAIKHARHLALLPFTGKY